MRSWNAKKDIRSFIRYFFKNNFQNNLKGFHGGPYDMIM